MISSFVSYLTAMDDLFWRFFAFFCIMFLGMYLTVSSRFHQLRKLPGTIALFFSLMKGKSQGEGVHPLKIFFASAGGMIGIGNIVGVATAVQIGGPGALLWVWIAGFVGGVVKYSEIYLGMKFRVQNKDGGSDGGPMYYLKRVFRGPFIPTIVALLLCVYGVEIYQFSVITASVEANWHISRWVVCFFLLGSVFWAAFGGVRRIGSICTTLMPLFLLCYMFMGLYVFIKEWATIPYVVADVFRYAFTSHAAVGGFVGSSILLTIQQGLSRAIYSSDVGIGYDSIIQSESWESPLTQAKLSVLAVITDNLVCSFSILLILLTGVWTDPMEGSQLVQIALAKYFPCMSIFMPLFLIITGYTTLITFFCVGLKCASYLHPRGRRVYSIYALFAFTFFTFFSQTHALLVMSLSGAMLLIINLLGVFLLRKEIDFELTPSKQILPIKN